MPKSQISSSPFAKFRAEAARQNDEADAANRAKRQGKALAQTALIRAAEPKPKTSITPPPATTVGMKGEPLLYYRARVHKFRPWLDKEVIMEGPLVATEAKLVTRVGVMPVYEELRGQLPTTAAFDIPAAYAAVVAMGDYTTVQGHEELRRAYNEVAGRLCRRLFDLTEAVAYTTA